MNRIRRRAWIMLVFMAILVGGMGFFLVEFGTKGHEWVTFRGSPHVYQGASLVAGQITDRDGTVLLDTTDGRVYSENRTIRQATLHWLGDRQGNPEPGIRRDQLLALVTAVRRRGKLLEPGHPVWEFYRGPWRWLRPLRPWLLKLFYPTVNEME